MNWPPLHDLHPYTLVQPSDIDDLLEEIGNPYNGEQEYNYNGRGGSPFSQKRYYDDEREDYGLQSEHSDQRINYPQRLGDSNVADEHDNRHGKNKMLDGYSFTLPDLNNATTRLMNTVGTELILKVLIKAEMNITIPEKGLRKFLETSHL